MPKPPGPPLANAAAGPSNPQMQPPQQRNPGQLGQQPLTPQMSGQPPPNQRGNKRNSSSPGQEVNKEAFPPLPFAHVRLG